MPSFCRGSVHHLGERPALALVLCLVDNSRAGRDIPPVRGQARADGNREAYAEGLRAAEIVGAGSAAGVVCGRGTREVTAMSGDAGFMRLGRGDFQEEREKAIRVHGRDLQGEQEEPRGRIHGRDM
ncbi:hypothetical protein NDU88_004983 [Pleurodeles waltl]|uniref:Uncharacterized protein n=1 Tax=Pleurodeles waltl TaxID=8319 RepID=A0AAV7T9H2_PLEWA|nr:hypothetical protein NDU88_004983 [Pleurodeles waltl]